MEQVSSLRPHSGGIKRDYILGKLVIFFGAVDLFALISRYVHDQIDSNLPNLLITYLTLTLLGYALGHYIGTQLDLENWRKVSSMGLILLVMAGNLQTILGVAA